jgi:hypothetical protein
MLLDRLVRASWLLTFAAFLFLSFPTVASILSVVALAMFVDVGVRCVTRRPSKVPRAYIRSNTTPPATPSVTAPLHSSRST